jgi:hypothetical protein
MPLGADGLNMIRSRTNRRIEGNVAPAVFLPPLYRFGSCFKSEHTIVMDLAACFSSAEANRRTVFRAGSKETAPSAARQIFTLRLRAIEGDQP